MENEVLALEMRGIRKDYSSFGQIVHALTDGNLSVKAGTVHGLLGENGAGKSTMMKILNGVERADAGEILLDGREVRIHDAIGAGKLGIGMVHQHFSLIPAYTVVQNVLLGREPANRFGILNEAEARKNIGRVIEQYGFDMAPDDVVGELSMGQRQKVEILRLLCSNTRIMVFDEPTSVLVEQEIRQLMDTIRQLKAQGKTIIYISHKVEEVLEITDELTVLRNGVTVSRGRTAELNADDIVEMMVGRKVRDDLVRDTSKIGDVVLRVRDLKVENGGREAVRGVSFDMRAGSVTGIAGINGNGQQELVESLFGLRHVSSGTVELDGRDITSEAPLARRRMGFGYIPEDRIHVGACLKATIAENFSVVPSKDPRFEKKGILNWKNLNARADDLIREYSVKAAGSDEYVGALSGGHIQRTILARELSSGPKVLLACETTMGLDVESVHYIYQFLEKMKENGCSILLISSNINEILTLSDEILVIHEGALTAKLTNGPGVDSTLIGAYMLGIRDQFKEGGAES